MGELLTRPETGAFASAPGNVEKVRGWFRWTLRIAITLHALDALTQAVFAGRFLAGSYGMLQAHLDNANFGISTISAIQVVVAVLYWRPGGGRGRPVLASLALTGAEAIQITLGLNRVLGVHIPLGVLIIMVAGWFATWSWRPAFGRRRGSAA